MWESNKYIVLGKLLCCNKMKCGTIFWKQKPNLGSNPVEGKINPLSDGPNQSILIYSGSLFESYQTASVTA